MVAVRGQDAASDPDARRRAHRLSAPSPRVPIRWRTEITAWEPPFRFIDEQIRGPYRVWIHEHRVQERDGRTIAADHVRYRPIGGLLVQKLLVERDVRAIFDYRKQRLTELFGADRAADFEAASQRPT